MSPLIDSLGLALTLVLGAPSSILVPQVTTNQVLHFQTRNRITGPFDHTMVTNTTVRILPPTTGLPGLHFSVSAVTEGHEDVRELAENTTTFQLISTDGPIGEGIAPLGYTEQMFGSPPTTLTVGARWSAAVVHSVLGAQGTARYAVTALDSANRRCLIDVTFDGSWSQSGSYDNMPVTGQIHRTGHGSVIIVNGIIEQFTLKGEERQTYPGEGPTDSYFDFTRVLLKR